MNEPLGLTATDKQRIDAMTHEDMARAWRFTPPGEWPFQAGPAFDYFKQRFDELGGFTPTVSKCIGW